MTNDTFDHIFIQPGNFDASLSFYRDVLGWDVVGSWGGDGEMRGAILGSEAMQIVIAESHHADDHSKSHGINGTRPTIHLRVTDIDQRYQDIAPTGTALFKPESTHWGSRWFVARDPDGNLVAFEQPTP